MHMLALITLGFAMPSAKPQDTDYPHRDWGEIAHLDMTAVEGAACVTRQLARIYGRVTPVPAEGGTDIEGGPGGGLLGAAHDPWVSYQVRASGDGSTLRVFYRHPVSAKNVGRDVRRMTKKCLRVARITAGAP